jgi:hypothetical protein
MPIWLGASHMLDGQVVRRSDPTVLRLIALSACADGTQDRPAARNCFHSPRLACTHGPFLVPGPPVHSMPMSPRRAKHPASVQAVFFVLAAAVATNGLQARMGRAWHVEYWQPPQRAADANVA